MALSSEHLEGPEGRGNKTCLSLEPDVMFSEIRHAYSSKSRECFTPRISLRQQTSVMEKITEIPSLWPVSV
jgi:hypothetical protein